MEYADVVEKMMMTMMMMMSALYYTITLSWILIELTETTVCG
jgi:hypothetical protein